MTDVEAKREAQEIDAMVIRLQPQLVLLPPRTRVLEIARYLLSTGRVLEPHGNNNGVPRYLFMDGEWDEVRGRGLAWCAGFVLYCYRQALHEIPGNRWLLREVKAMFELAAKTGVLIRTLPDLIATPGPGDIIFLYGRRGSDNLNDDTGIRHCGIVEAVDGDQVHSIEGNWSNKLSVVTRQLNDATIAGYGRF